MKNDDLYTWHRSLSHDKVASDLVSILGGFASNPSPRMIVVEGLKFWNLDPSSASMYQTLRPSVNMRRRSAKRVSTGDNFCNYGPLKMIGGS